jgi:drug/metabolite transporter (DMT)-like permease
MSMVKSNRVAVKGIYTGGGLILLATLCIVLMNACAKMSSTVYTPVEMIPWILGIGVFTAIQQLAKTAAFRHCEASFLAPYTYMSMVWATLVGWLLWQEIITAPVMLGTGVVVASNLFILKRTAERSCESLSQVSQSPY